VVGPRVSSQNKKITAARLPDPTPNKGDAGSLTIVAYTTKNLVVHDGRFSSRIIKFSS
jgi:hypothetical protein